MAIIEIPKRIIPFALWLGWMGFWFVMLGAALPAKSGLEQFNAAGAFIFLVLGMLAGVYMANERLAIVGVK